MVLQCSQKNLSLSVFCQAITTPLLLVAFSGCEGLSESYQFRLQVFSKAALSEQALIGQAMRVELVKFSQAPRYFQGYIKQIKKQSCVRNGWWEYQIVITSFLDWLDLGSDCRIFQDKTTPEIVKQIFSEHGILDVQWDITQDYQKLNYSVQYNETHFQFIIRLLSDAGIFFYFLHDNESAKMIFSDSIQSYFPVKLEDKIKSWQETLTSKNSAFDFVHYNLVDDKVNSVRGGASGDGAVSQIYPGNFNSLAEGSAKAHQGSRLIEQQKWRATGVCHEASLRPGNEFHNNNNYVVEKIFHFAKINKTEVYFNNFFAVLSENSYLPKWHEKTKINGVQTALVCGPNEAQVYCDQLGRIKVYFHWDRYRKFATWIRVAHPVAGKNYGVQFTPQVGQEVIVHFEEGDPDRPIITGALYNGANKPPFDLPKHKTQSGIRSKAHEICMEDKDQKQFFQIKTKRDYFERVLGDRFTAVKNHQKVIIKGNALTQILRGTQKTLSSQSIILKSGESTLEIKPNEIKLNGRVIKFN